MCRQHPFTRPGPQIHCVIRPHPFTRPGPQIQCVNWPGPLSLGEGGGGCSHKSQNDTDQQQTKARPHKITHPQGWCPLVWQCVGMVTALGLLIGGWSLLVLNTAPSDVHRLVVTSCIGQPCPRLTAGLVARVHDALLSLQIPSALSLQCSC